VLFEVAASVKGVRAVFGRGHLLDGGGVHDNAAPSTVALLARTDNMLAEICDALNACNSDKCAYYRACDLTASDEVQRALSGLILDMGGVDVLINNASDISNKELLDMSGDEWARSLTTGVTAAFHCTQAVVPHFMAQGAGYIINISSLSSRIPLERGTSYAASKHALNGFSASMVHQLHRHGIKVCTIYPGAFIDDPAKSDWKMPADEVFRACEYAINAHPRAFVEQIVVRPVRWPD
jgi:NAD(P)-dependent dehydrogenase (short-subunit alcohol dehydrogenase family)